MVRNNYSPLKKSIFHEKNKKKFKKSAAPPDISSSYFNAKSVKSLQSKEPLRRVYNKVS